MKLSLLLPAGQIVVPLSARTKDAVVDELLALLPIADEAQRAAVRESVLSRETELSTGIGRGVAIPHGKTAVVARHACAFGVVPVAAGEGVDWAAIDSLPCRIVFLCVSNPKDAGEHVRVLSQVARVLNDSRARAALENAATPDDVRRIFIDDEAREGL
ncbi:MAG: PTS sugar transporter subunit IIA [Planctomycetes bacterium]|nr:PTS sugar transporter subunit IIA [Planctomycetota bacterium]